MRVSLNVAIDGDVEEDIGPPAGGGVGRWDARSEEVV